MEKDIGNFFKWCEDRGKSTTIICRMSDDEMRESKLYKEYISHLMLLKNYFRIAGDDYVDDEYRDLNRDDDIFKTTLLDHICFWGLLFLVIFAGLVFGGIFD